MCSQRLPIISVFLGSCFTLVANAYPVQGQITNSNEMLLAQTVMEALPPPPNYSQNQSIEFNQDQPYQPYQPVQYPYNQSVQRYAVYVENSSRWILQRIQQQVERTAYIRQLNGRSVIMSGTFSRRANAEQRVRELDAIGIYGARVATSDTGEVQSYYPNNDPYSNPNNSNYSSNKSQYYVSIPTKSEDLSIVANQVRRVTGLYGFVLERKKPLGPHVAVGPFNQRIDAEKWNTYIRDRGFGNARVYYGK